MMRYQQKQYLKCKLFNLGRPGFKSRDFVKRASNVSISLVRQYFFKFY